MPSKYTFLTRTASREVTLHGRTHVGAFLNNVLPEPVTPKGDSIIRLNGIKVDSYQRTLEVSQSMYPVAVQYVDEKGRPRKVVTCRNEHELREAIPFHFFGGYTVLRASPVWTPPPPPRRPYYASGWW